MDNKSSIEYYTVHAAFEEHSSRLCKLLSSLSFYCDVYFTSWISENKYWLGIFRWRGISRQNSCLWVYMWSRNYDFSSLQAVSVQSTFHPRIALDSKEVILNRWRPWGTPLRKSNAVPLLQRVATMAQHLLGPIKAVGAKIQSSKGSSCEPCLGCWWLENWRRALWRGFLSWHALTHLPAEICCAPAR